MRDGIKATTQFIRYRIVSFLVLCIACGGLFFTSIILQYQSGVNLGFESQNFTQSRYVFYPENASEQQLNSLIIELNLLQLPMQECFLTDTVDIEYGELLPNNIEEPVTMMTFYPDLPSLEDNLRVKDGNTVIVDTQNECMLTFTTANMLSTSVVNSISNSEQIRRQLSTREIIGEIIVNGSTPLTPISSVYFTSYSHAGVIVAYERFFELTSSCEYLSIQFSEPLNKSQEDSFLKIVGQCLHVRDLEMPYVCSESDIQSHRDSVQINNTILFACALSIAFLYQYLLQSRNHEMSVSRMVGATPLYVVTQSMCLLFFSIITSFLVGLGLIFFSRLFPQANRWLSKLTFSDFALSGAQFVGILCLCVVLNLTYNKASQFIQTRGHISNV